ncbi:MAG: GNAT family N-acetyltransferase [Armatimonadetes bacterium]|nr:GNAT family N-acetyltransferase [Armatimonadota bacterium]
MLTAAERLPTASGSDIARQLARDEGFLQFALPSREGDPLTEVILDPHNARVKLLGVTATSLAEGALSAVQAAWSEHPGSFTKLTACAPAGEDRRWRGLGFRREAIIRGFFADGAPAHLWASYANLARAANPRRSSQDEIVKLAAGKEPRDVQLPAGYRDAPAGERWTGAIAQLLGQTFSQYPSSLRESDLRARIHTGSSVFRVIFDEGGELAAVASAEIDHRRKHAEMTDCATRPSKRGQGLMSYLLASLERELWEQLRIGDLYTLARAEEVGMNRVFARLGYVYTGRLTNNCRMPGGWESMNVWCKTTARAEE